MNDSGTDRTVTMTELVAAIDGVAAERVVVGVSGFGGSGKSTLARELVARVPRSARIRGDDFLDPARSHLRSDDWNGVERARLRREVLEPFRAGESGEFRRYDWSAGRLGAPEPVPTARVLIVDAVGLLHPELEGALDLTIWVDVDLETATARGKLRGRQQRSDHDALWDEVWVPTELAFLARFDPRARADHLFKNDEVRDAQPRSRAWPFYGARTLTVRCANLLLVGSVHGQIEELLTQRTRPRRLQRRATGHRAVSVH